MTRPRHRRAMRRAAFVPAAVAAGLAAGPVVGSGDDPLEQVRQATSTFQDVDAAIDAGYVQFFGCVNEPLAGST